MTDQWMKDWMNRPIDMSGWQAVGRMEVEIVKLMNPHLEKRAKAMAEIKAIQPPLSDTVAAALRRAFNLGQIYFQQGDSESYSQNAKADITRSKFDALLAETAAAVAKSTGAAT